MAQTRHSAELFREKYIKTATQTSMYIRGSPHRHSKNIATNSASQRSVRASPLSLLDSSTASQYSPGSMKQFLGLTTLLLLAVFLFGPAVGAA
ncbi:MAG TPA: hypothetical protein VF182_03485, partial [Candidatus Binatia bacterium]